MFDFNEHYELILSFSEFAEVDEHSKHPSNNEQFNSTFFEHTTIETLPNSPNSTLSSTSKIQHSLVLPKFNTL